jgi:hypothetical protein
VETVQGWFSKAGDEGVSANEFGSRDVNEVHDGFCRDGVKVVGSNWKGFGQILCRFLYCLRIVGAFLRFDSDSQELSFVP